MIERLHETGYDEALLGLALSYHDPAVPIEQWWDGARQAKAAARADKLAHKHGGHNKFLESVTVQLLVNAPRYWWSEFDTYRVGTTKQSESTMHTLAKRPPSAADFHPATPAAAVECFVLAWPSIKHDVQQLKAALPEGFLQRRMVVTNYKTLQNIVAQRADHRLPEWREFCTELAQMLKHPQWLRA